MNIIEEMGARAKEAKRFLATASTADKNKGLLAISDTLVENAELILQENKKDLAQAKADGMSQSMQDRLLLTKERIRSMANACVKLAGLEDPVGTVEGGHVCPNGMRITKVHVPMGVIGIIYEARPNVTVDAAALCFKSGNAVILRGGKEAFHSNQMLAKLMRNAVATVGFPEDCIQLVQDISRETSVMMMKANGWIDVLIPRGGAGLIRAVVQNATVPVIETGTGNCHLFVDKTADLQMAVDILDNGKTQRPSVCNALETCLVHKDVAEAFLPMMKECLDAHQVELRGCPVTKSILGDGAKAADEADYATEFLDYILAVRVVDDVDAAIAHIAQYSTGHSECIVTSDLHNAEKFQKYIDSAAVYVNCSTRFTDGEEFGLGAEIGISTQKLHARGPMGLKELTTVKYLVNGDGQIR